MKPKKPLRNGAALKKRLPKWKRHTDDYRSDELSRVLFATVNDMDEAIGIFWGGALTGMPFHLGGDGLSLIVPKTGAGYFMNAGLRYTKQFVGC